MTEEKCLYRGHWVNADYEMDECKFPDKIGKPCLLCLMGQLVEAVIDIELR